MIAERERQIHTRIGRLPADQCDFAGPAFCPAPVIAIVETVDYRLDATIDRRPACALHAEAMAHYPAGSGMSGRTHYLERAGQ